MVTAVPSVEGELAGRFCTADAVGSVSGEPAEVEGEPTAERHRGGSEAVTTSSGSALSCSAVREEEATGSSSPSQGATCLTVGSTRAACVEIG